MARLHYLTVQDILWINHQLAKKVLGFRYATLEEATFYQYSYGESTEVPAQAVRFLTGFLRLKPLDALNEATGLVGAIAFVRINGGSVDLADTDCDVTALWVRENAAGFAERIQMAHPDEHGEHAPPAVRDTISAIIREYPLTLPKLSMAEIVGA